MKKDYLISVATNMYMSLRSREIRIYYDRDEVRDKKDKLEKITLMREKFNIEQQNPYESIYKMKKDDLEQLIYELSTLLISVTVTVL